VPSGHARRQAKQHAVNTGQAEPLLEQQIAHPERQHRAETVTDELESFEKGHDVRLTAKQFNSIAVGSAHGSFARSARP